MAEDKKNPKEASNIFHSIMKASVSKGATEKKPKPWSSEQLAISLKEDLLKSQRGSKDKIYLKDDYIVVEIPANDDFETAINYLTPVVDASMVKHGANRAAVKITDGTNEEILSWGF